MNKKQIRRHFDGGTLYGWYRFRDWDDPDDDGTPTLKAETPAEGLDDYKATKKLMALLVREYDVYMNGRY